MLNTIGIKMPQITAVNSGKVSLDESVWED